jgi:hypothetical protein
MKVSKLKLALTIVAIAAIYLFVTPEQAPYGPPLKLIKISADSQPEICGAKSRCIVAYLAPWCPSCRRELASLMRARSLVKETGNEVGMKIVVGSGRPEEIEQMARRIGGEVFSDPEGVIFDAFGGKYYPSWWIFDSQGNVLKETEMPGRIGRLIYGDTSIRRALELTQFPRIIAPGDSGQ